MSESSNAPKTPSASLEGHLDVLKDAGNFTATGTYNTAAKVLELFKTIVPDFRERLNNLGTGIMALINPGQKNEVSAKSLMANLDDAKEVAVNYDFLNYGERYITVPENFKGNLLKYIRDLTEVNRDVMRDVMRYLGDYNRSLAIFISSKDEKLAITTHSNFVAEVEKTRLNGKAKLDPYFPKNTGVSKAMLRNVMTRFADMEPLVKATIILHSQQDERYLNSLSDGVDNSVKQLDIIIKQIRTGRFDKVSPEAIDNIVRGAYEMGKLVEMASILYHDSRVAITSVIGILSTVSSKE